MSVRGLSPVPRPPDEPSGKQPMLTAPVVWLFISTLGFTALMNLVGHVNLYLAFGLPLLGAIALLSAIGIGRGASTMYRDIIAFIRRRMDGQGPS
jgi:hypothetical protein